MQRWAKLSAALMILVVCAVGRAATAKKADRPSDKMPFTGCVTPECHANIKQYRITHAPVAADSCDACHEWKDVRSHTFDFPRRKADMCTYCHEFRIDNMPVVHRPLIEGECLGCHDPHGGRNRDYVRENTTAELCGRCHDSVTHDRKFIHTPVKQGECSSCHPSHASRYPKLLYAEGSALCLTCHTDFQKLMARATFRHKAMDEGCARCHDPHGANQPMQVTGSVPDLCISCHEPIKQNVAAAEHKHRVVMQDRSCLTCHTSHGGDYAKLMADLPIRVCMGCHKEDVKTETGRVVAALPELNNPLSHKHGPIKEGQCNGCHTTHGGDRDELLTKALSRAFYQRFSPEKFELCFSCHDVRMVTFEQGRGVTGFRDGDRNLHFAHANEGDRGRNCRVCHATHTAGNEMIVRDTVPYGKWQLPIGFAKTATGGSCVAGCHVAYSYDREKPVLPATRPAEAQPATLAGGPPTPPAPVDWTLRSIHNTAVKIPAGNRPSIILFLRAGQVLNDTLVNLVRSAVPSGTMAQVVVILSGPTAAEQAMEMAPRLPWPVIVDGDFERSGELNVHTWPTTMVLREDGTQVVRIGGVPHALGVELEAYIALAAGRIDRAQLAQRLRKHEIVGDTPQRRAARQADAARRLLADGRAGEAKQLLNEMMRAQPDSLALQVLMIEAMAKLKEGKAGLELLKTIPPNAIPAWQRDYLRGLLLLADGKFADARIALAAALRANPDLPDAHYHLGTIYEREKNFEKAAQEFRLASQGRR